MAVCLSDVITKGMLETSTSPRVIMLTTPVQEPFLLLAPAELSAGFKYRDLQAAEGSVKAEPPSVLSHAH
jgi:hypothetical protein